MTGGMRVAHLGALASSSVHMLMRDALRLTRHRVPDGAEHEAKTDLGAFIKNINDLLSQRQAYFKARLEKAESQSAEMARRVGELAARMDVRTRRRWRSRWSRTRRCFEIQQRSLHNRIDPRIAHARRGHDARRPEACLECSAAEIVQTCFGRDSRPEPTASQQPYPHPTLSTLRCPGRRVCALRFQKKFHSVGCRTHFV